MSDVDLSEFYRLSAKTSKKRPCQIRMILEGRLKPELKPAERKQLQAAITAIQEGFVSNGGVRDWLAARGHKVNVNAISNHRRKVCNCD